MRTTLLALLLLAASTTPAIAQDDLPGFALHVRAGDRSVPLALPHTRSPDGNAAAATVWETVRRDLEMSGYFNIVDPNAYFEAADAGIEPGSFPFTSWQSINAAALAKTRVRQTRSGLEATLYLYDVGVGSKIIGKRYGAGPDGARFLGHKVADAILEALGADGFFDHRLTAIRKVRRTVGGQQVSRKGLYIIGVDGEGAVPVTRSANDNLSPAWSPSGNALAWTRLGDRQEVVFKDLASGRLRVLSGTPGVNTGAAFSPDGNTVALARSASGDTDIFLIDARTGTQIRQLTTGGGIDVSPSFSPDGSLVAFGGERSGGSQIFVVPVTGGEPRRVTFDGTWNYEPAFSPDGRRIAFTGRDRNHDIFVVDVDGQHLIRVTQAQGDNESPSWSPDGRYLVFSSTRTGTSEIWLATADGRDQVQVTTGGGWSQPAWNPHGR